MAQSEIEGVELAILQNYIDRGRVDTLPAEIEQYLSQIELVRGLLLRFESKTKICKLLQAKPYELSQYIAQQRINDAINFFYIQNDVKRDAWRGLYADKLDNIATAMIKMASTVKDIKMAVDTMVKAAEMRGVFDDEEENFTEEMLAKAIRIYTTDITKLGHEKINRKELAGMIDSYKIPESVRERIKEEAMVEDPKFLPDEQITD